MPWPLVVEAADHHLVAPALGWCVRGEECIPVDVRQCFETLLDLNRRRNVIIERALEAAVGSLNDAGITPMLLKGAATLAEDLYPDPGIRVVGDLDLLVRERDAEAADAALERAGFRLEAPLPNFDRDPHHLPPRVHTVLRVSLDLHTRPVVSAIRTLLDASQVLDNGRPRTWRGRALLLPDPAHWMIHTIAHSQITDGHYWRGIPRLRQILALGALAHRYPKALNRALTHDGLAHTRYRKIFAETMLLTDVLLEGKPAAMLSESAARVVERTRMAVEHPAARRWSVYRQFVARNARRLIEQPRFIMRPLRPSFWVRYGARVRRRAQIERW